MSKNWFTRLTRIVSDRFGSEKEDGLSLEASLNHFERFVHFWVLVCRSFVRNRCPVRASSLSYTTILAFIPILAVVLSITNAILQSEGEARIKYFIEEFVDKMIPNTSGLETNKPGKTVSQNGTAAANDPTAAVIESSAATTELVADFTNRLAKIQIDEASFRVALGTHNDTAILTDGQTVATSASNTNNPMAVARHADATTVAGVKQAKKNVAHEAANYIYEFADKSDSKTLGFTGMIFLVLTAILTLTRVEETFNDIWGVTRGRDWWSRITNYFFTIALGPVLIITALGLANGPNFQKTRDLIKFIPFLEPFLTNYLPVIIICFTFAVIYKIVPNTKVDFGAALVGGSLAGIAWHGYNHLGFLLASRAVNANAIYGSLFILPLMMGGLYVVWLTILFGAQVAYAYQNRAAYLQDQIAENVNQRGREFVALRLMTFIGQRFNRGLSPATIREISTELGVPSKLAQQVLRTLLAARLVVEVSGVESGYTPARPLDAITCHNILIAMRATQGQELVTRDEPVRAEVLGEFARIQAAEESAAASVTMLALVNRAHARLELAAPATPQLAPATTSPVFEPIVLTAEQHVEAAPAIVLTDTPTIEEAFSSPTSPKASDRVEDEKPDEAEKPKPVLPTNISSAAATTFNSIHDNESFPL